MSRYFHIGFPFLQYLHMAKASRSFVHNLSSGPGNNMPGFCILTGDHFFVYTKSLDLIHKSNQTLLFIGKTCKKRTFFEMIKQ